MASKKVSINIDKRAKIEYPTASIAANIVPAMRTPDSSFPLRVSVLATELDENGKIIGAPINPQGAIDRSSLEGQLKEFPEHDQFTSFAIAIDEIQSERVFFSSIF